MDETLVTTLLADLCTLTDQPTPTREEVRVWAMSGVERVTFSDSRTSIFKYAVQPFDSENRALRLAHSRGIPVPQLHASALRDGWLGILMEDLGTAIRDADDLDGLAAAVVLHSARIAHDLPLFDESALRSLPTRALGHLDHLRKADRWQGTADIESALGRIAQAAAARAAGTMIAPFGWVHSEFHPTSLHIGQGGWHLLDFARAFTGPGLLLSLISTEMLVICKIIGTSS